MYIANDVLSLEIVFVGKYQTVNQFLFVNFYNNIEMTGNLSEYFIYFEK